MTDGIEVSGLRRSFGSVQALRAVDFHAAPGSITALVGPNGAGKTTLMLTLATLLRPDGGEVCIDGIDPIAEPQRVRARLGWMPDVLGSWPTLSVRTTLRITARMYRMSAAAAAERAEEMIDLSGLREHADQPTRVLSRGQKQLLSLARALTHEPSVLVLDEPASGLDPAARVHLRTLLRERAAAGATVLLSSHVLAELDELADAAVYLAEGSTVDAARVADARGGLRAWRIRAIDPVGLPAALAACGFPVERTHPDNLGTLVDLYGEADAAALLSALVGRGVQVSAFAPAVGDLEHTFLDLSGGER